MKNYKMSKMVLRFSLVIGGIILWAMIEALEMGSFMYIFPAALILFSFEKISKDIVKDTYKEKSLADSVRVVRIKQPVDLMVNEYSDFDDMEYIPNQKPRIKICM